MGEDRKEEFDREENLRETVKEETGEEKESGCYNISQTFNGYATCKKYYYEGGKLL